MMCGKPVTIATTIVTIITVGGMTIAVTTIIATGTTRIRVGRDEEPGAPAGLFFMCVWCVAAPAMRAE